MVVNFKKIWLILSSLAAAAVLLLAILLGANSGRTAAQAQIIAQTASNLSSGLNYFFSDQNRFPTATEFSDQNLMLNYFSTWPPVDFGTGACSQSYIYKRVSANSYQLSFCLPQATGKFQQGWNSVNGQPPPAN